MSGCGNMGRLVALVVLAFPPSLQTANASPPTADMEISRADTRKAVRGPSDRFTGTVLIEPMFDAQNPSRVSAGQVTFAPGARSAWHRHPLGQHLVITKGVGRTQIDGGPIVEMHAGDVVWCPPGVRHWHGASPTSAVTHIAIQEAFDGTNVEWFEKVTEAEYGLGTGR